MNPPNQPPAPHSASNGFDTSINPTPPTFLGSGLPQQTTAPFTVAVNSVQVQPRQPHNGLIDYRTWLNTQPTQVVHRPNVLPVPTKPKRVRTGFTTQQLIVLEKQYAKVPYLPRSQRIELAETLQLTERTIKIWFQNRRMKAKKEKLEGSEDILEMMVPYPIEATNPPMKQNIILEQRQYPVSAVRTISSDGTISLNSSLKELVQDFKYDYNQQHANVQYKHPFAPTIQVQSSQSLVLEQHKYTPWRNEVTQPVVRQMNFQTTIASISSSQGIVQDLQFNKQQHPNLLYRSAAATAQMQGPQNFIPEYQYPSWTNGVTQKTYHPMVSSETITSKFSSQNNFQNLQHDRQQYSSVQNRHPAVGTAAQMEFSQNLVSGLYHPPRKIQNGTRPELCSVDSVKTVPLKVFEDFYKKTLLDKQNSVTQYGQPVISNEQSSPNSISEYVDPLSTVHLEFSEESSRSSIENILQDLLRCEQQYLETKQKETKQMQALHNFITGEYSASMNEATQHSFHASKQFHLFQTESLHPAPDLPSDLLDVTPMEIEDIDINLYLL